MTKDKALKLALEALVEVKSWKSPTRWDGCFDKEITAIKEALSSCQCPECRLVLHASDCAVHNEPAYPKDECNCVAQCKPLTDEEIILIVAECASSHQHTDIHFARAIEAAHGIKGKA